MCSSGRQCPGDRSTAHQAHAASPWLVRDARRTSCRPECADADAQTPAIPPCRPAFGQDIRVGDRRTRLVERARRYVALECATRARVWRKQTPDEAAHQHAPRAVSPAKARPSDLKESQLARRAIHITVKIRSRARSM